MREKNYESFSNFVYKAMIYNVQIILNVKLLMVSLVTACWSPKGKQVVIGTQDGQLLQYDQTLTLKKEWQCPSSMAVNGGSKGTSFFRSFLKHF